MSCGEMLFHHNIRSCTVFQGTWCQQNYHVNVIPTWLVACVLCKQFRAAAPFKWKRRK